jgi:hypothetical protein
MAEFGKQNAEFATAFIFNLGRARVSRVGDGFLASANFSQYGSCVCAVNLPKRLFPRDTEIDIRDGCAPQI